MRFNNRAFIIAVICIILIFPTSAQAEAPSIPTDVPKDVISQPTEPCDTVDDIIIYATPEVTPMSDKKIEKSTDYDIIDTVFIPSYSGFKSYMGHDCFCSSSNQYKLQQVAETEPKTGLRMIKGRYIVAVGSGVGTNIGQYFDLVLENGTVIPCCMGDLKDDIHTDSSNLITSHSDCCSEFIVDMNQLDTTVKRMGDVSYMWDDWKSPVTEIIVYDMTYENDVPEKENKKEENTNVNSTVDYADSIHTTETGYTWFHNERTKTATK